MNNNIKRYCLLENGWIEPCYYDKEMEEMRCIYPEGRRWFIDHDKYGNGCMIRFHHKIIKFADTKKELREYWKKKNEGKKLKK